MGKYIKKGKYQARKPKKKICEICGENNISTLHEHHIIPRTDERCTDDWHNVVIVCANCHNKIHSNQIEIIGIYPSTKLPYKRSVIFSIFGKSILPNL
jgi:hypothetical protein